MTLRFDLPDVVPVFPLPGALILPRAKLPLHVFEPRYLNMFEDCLKTPHRLIAMVQPFPGADEGLHNIGCAGRVTQFSETEDGRYMITLSGVSRFKVKEEVDGFAPYRRAHVIWDGFEDDLGKEEFDSEFQREGFLDKLTRYFSDQELATDWDALSQAEDELLINSLAMLCPFAPEDKQALLEAPTLTARRQTLETLIEFALQGGAQEDVLQ